LGSPRKSSEQNNLESEPSKEELAGLKRIVKAVNQLHAELSGYKTVTCFETTTGSGTNLGYNFQQLGFIRENIIDPSRIGFCFDTCHVTAAGYDMTTSDRAKQVLQKFDTDAGLEHIKVFHFNDSKGSVGSRIDRHDHIGLGTCGLSCFRTILELKQFDNVPKILETSKEENENGVKMDVVNIAKLRKMAKSALKHR
jgi:deoxyribonuclease-4